ncbi:MAG TPA: hypothetical protein VGH58_07745 [Solirubrobacterales bacterium]|jgi:hypothetical protein
MKDKDKQRLMLRAGVVGLAVVVALIAWLATRGGGGASEESSAAAKSDSKMVSEAELGETAAALGQPVYWAGAQAGNELELTELSEGGGTQVRYVPEGTEVGGGSAALLTIGSYPLPNPEKALEGFAKRPGSIVRHGKGGAEVVSSEESPTSAYFVSPDNSVQVEVYDPSPQRAMSLALSGRVQPAH